ncbi:MAG: flagellar motor switch protein FliN [Deltaproteobacteria bacterium]|nr:flagellar motor switch protein FliN [Deltaproteobacteria bacterium]
MAEQEKPAGVSQDDIDKLLQDSDIEEAEEAVSAAHAGAAGGAAAPEGTQDGLGAKPAKPQRTLTAGGNGHRPLPAGAPRDLEFLLDVPLRVSVEVGRTKMSIGDLLELGPGSIVELDKLAGEPLDIFINQKLIARGEAVIINEKFGVRLTDVISKIERLENLKT